MAAERNALRAEAGLDLKVDRALKVADLDLKADRALKGVDHALKPQTDHVHKAVVVDRAVQVAAASLIMAVVVESHNRNGPSGNRLIIRSRL